MCQAFLAIALEVVQINAHDDLHLHDKAKTVAQSTGNRHPASRCHCKDVMSWQAGGKQSSFPLRATAIHRDWVARSGLRSLQVPVPAWRVRSVPKVSVYYPGHLAACKESFSKELRMTDPISGSLPKSQVS